MTPIADYMTKDTKLPSYIPFPRFLLGADLTLTTQLLYALLLDRATLSQKSGWVDEQGRLYIVFPIGKIADALNRSPMTAKNCLNELEAAGLIERKRQGFSAPNRIYVKLPDGQETVLLMDRKLSVRSKGNCPTDGQKTLPMMDKKLSPNNKSINNKSINNKSNNDLNRARGTPAAYGRYGNVFLSESNYRELQEEIPGLDNLIEQLSGYMKSEGKQYEDHAATLRRWAANEYSNRAAPKQGIPDYTYKEGQSL